MSLREIVFDANRPQPEPEGRVLSSEEGLMLPTAPLSMAAASNSADELLARMRELRAHEDEDFAELEARAKAFKEAIPKEEERFFADLRKRRSKQECETGPTAWTALSETRFIMLVQRFLPTGVKDRATKHSIVDHMHNIYNDETEFSSSFIEGKDIDSYMEALSAYGAGDTTVKRFEPRYAIRPTFEEIDKKLANMLELKVRDAIIKHKRERAETNGNRSSSNGHASSSNGHASSSNGHTSSSNGHASSSNGHASSSNGNGLSSNRYASSSNGHASSSNGHALSSNGHASSSNGHALSSNGHASSSNSNGSSSNGNGSSSGNHPGCTSS